MNPFRHIHRTAIGVLAAGLLSLGSLIARRYPLENINGAYDDLRSGAPGRGVITFPAPA